MSRLQPSSCVIRLERPPFASVTTRLAGYLSDARDGPRRVRSSRGVREQYPLWRGLPRAASGHTRLEIRSGRHSAPGLCDPLFPARTVPERACPRFRRRRQRLALACESSPDVVRLGAPVRRSARVVSISLICCLTKRRRSRSLRISASVFVGMATPSGVRRPSN